MDSLVAQSSENNSQESEACDSLFDKIIGHIEDLIMEKRFQSVQQYYLDKYWRVFEPVEENKLLYMEIFNEYNKAIESYIDTNLTSLIPNFSMNDFISELLKRRSELEGEVFEILLTFTDFLAFKELILDYRALQEGKVQDLSSGITVKSLSCIKISI
ncbi:ADP-ribosylation factor-like protein 2-binding protein isoform X2 [Phymastichus coffea]|uniref:ADP-ribosylation factor-like protein 2-binding protein isoform X2 n=1 Tax=Phymastichus coffea TaxID=108790 RepID=UPI00273CABEC|nr:ADP-ribosylation factor-like protein 2-binding protein isoform X2 [Phymastichus coffea]